MFHLAGFVALRLLSQAREAEYPVGLKWVMAHQRRLYIVFWEEALARGPSGILTKVNSPRSLRDHAHRRSVRGLCRGRRKCIRLSISTGAFQGRSAAWSKLAVHPFMVLLERLMSALILIAMCLNSLQQGPERFDCASQFVYGGI